MKVTMVKQYETVDGHKVRIYCTDGGGRFPVHGAMLEGDTWNPVEWLADGKWLSKGSPPTIRDLREVRPRIRQTMHLNVYGGCMKNGATHSSRLSADEMGTSYRLACIAIDLDIPEGYGLDKDEAPVTVKV